MVTGTVTNALRKLYKAIVGEDISRNKNNPTKIINELADNWPEGVTIEALSVTENDTYTAPEGKAYSPVTVNVSGGSSDLSTAKVTLINNTSEPDVTFSIPLVYEGVEGEYPSASTSAVVVEQNIAVDAVLYHGLCNAHIDGNFVLTGIGSVTIDGLYADITGDCTITASDPT